MAQSLRVSIIGDSRGYSRALAQASGSTAGFGRSVTSTFASIGKTAAVALGAAGLTGALVTIKRGFDELKESSQVGAQTNAVLTSTGQIANVTAKQVSSMATALSNLSGIDDEAVQAGENMLLTFTNIRNETGKGNDIFNQATASLADFATAMNRGAAPSAEQLSQKAILLGKALNDPVRGITALRKAGVQFTDGQKDQIKALVESGHVMEAQKLILRELTKEFGGSAKAAGRTLPGQLNRLKNSFDNIAASIVGGMIPSLLKGFSALNKFLGKFAAAEGISAKIKVTGKFIFEAAAGAFSALRKQISDLLFGEFVKGGGVGPEGIKFNQGLVAKVGDALGALDWTAVGKSITHAMADAIGATGELAKKFAQVITDATAKVDWVATGRTLGPGFAAMIASAFVTLTDPAFWAKNWDLALAIALTAFSGPLGKIAGKLLAPFAKLGGDMVLALAGAIERLSPRLASALLTGLNALGGIVTAAFTRLAGLAGSALGALEGVVRSFFGRLGAIAVFTIKVLGIQVAIQAIIDFGGVVGGILAGVGRSIAGVFQRAWDDIKVGALRAALAVVEPFSHLPFGLGGWAQKAKAAIQAQLDAIDTKRVVARMHAEFISQIGAFQRAGGDYRAAVKAGLEPLIVDGKLVGEKTGAATAAGMGSGVPAARSQGVALGAAMGSGVSVGILAYLPQAVAAAISLVTAAMSAARGAIGAQSPAKATIELGKDFVDGLVQGIIQNEGKAKDAAAQATQKAAAAATVAAVLASPAFAAAMTALGTAGTKALLKELFGPGKTRAQEGIERMRQAALDARSKFADAFRSLADKALAAFDARVAAWVNPFQKKLDAMQRQDQIASEKAGVAQATTDLSTATATAATAADALTAALAAGDAEAIATAQAAKDAAEKAVVDANAAVVAAQRVQAEGILQRKADDAAKAHEAEAARERQALMKELNTTLATLLKDHKGMAGYMADSAAAAKAIAGALRAALSALGGSPPARAGGGPVRRGVSYLVGEYGPELFTPSTSGGITANNRLSAGGGAITIPITLELDGATIANVTYKHLLRKQDRNGSLGWAT